MKFSSYNILKLEVILCWLLVAICHVVFKKVNFVIYGNTILVVLGRSTFASLRIDIIINFLSLSLKVFMNAIFEVSNGIVGSWEISLMLLLDVMVCVFVLVIIEIKMSYFLVWIYIYVLIL